MAQVLIVDDDPQVRAVLRLLLSALPRPVEISEAADVYTALAQIQTRRPDLILLDRALARATTANGLMVYYHQLVRTGRIPEIPIVMLSGADWSSLQGLQKAYPAIKRVFQKPFDVDEVQAAIVSLLPEQPVMARQPVLA